VYNLPVCSDRLENKSPSPHHKNFLWFINLRSPFFRVTFCDGKCSRSRLKMRFHGAVDVVLTAFYPFAVVLPDDKAVAQDVGGLFERRALFE
jgi:hypothetical protein